MQIFALGYLHIITNANFLLNQILYTVRARILNIQIPNPFDYRTFQSSVFEPSKPFENWTFYHSKTEPRLAEVILVKKNYKTV